MDELSLQSQQLQKEFEIINQRKKIKKNNHQNVNKPLNQQYELHQQMQM